MAMPQESKSPPAKSPPAIAVESQSAGGVRRAVLEGAGRLDLNELERRLLGDLFAIVSEHAEDSAVEIDRDRVRDAFVFACEHHAAQRRKSGEDFIVHPVGVARICAGMRLDTETLCAALLHDTVEDTSASIEEVRERFGEQIAAIVDGVTKLTGITFRSHDEAQTENYRKMMVAMATDVRVILASSSPTGCTTCCTIMRCPSRSRSRRRARRSIYTRRSHTGWGSTRSSGSPRGPGFSRPCTRVSTRRSRASSPSSRDERERYVAEAERSTWRASWRSWESSCRSRGAPSTSTRSTQR